MLLFLPSGSAKLTLGSVLYSLPESLEGHHWQDTHSDRTLVSLTGSPHCYSALLI